MEAGIQYDKTTQLLQRGKATLPLKANLRGGQERGGINMKKYRKPNKKRGRGGDFRQQAVPGHQVVPEIICAVSAAGQPHGRRQGVPLCQSGGSTGVRAPLTGDTPFWQYFWKFPFGLPILTWGEKILVPLIFREGYKGRMFVGLV